MVYHQFERIHSDSTSTKFKRSINDSNAIVVERYATSRPTKLFVAAIPVAIHNFIRLVYRSGSDATKSPEADDADNNGHQKPRNLYKRAQGSRNRNKQQRH
jgi:hypothetical protein